ncbi:Patatin-like phospholipase domain-containing protein 4 [Holothuria leucospilota]|uniref:Patatin-like phospholipase domain-containing protein 4 n=1 Tax=Holothuria leucospilota TaxID=206669 RepID=A0A9Q1BPP5_HOLLE|nr:Patatin-like phospholipase domain-containing protein 4 [Holothuria leucospilota]
MFAVSMPVATKLTHFVTVLTRQNFYVSINLNRLLIRNEVKRIYCHGSLQDHGKVLQRLKRTSFSYSQIIQNEKSSTHFQEAARPSSSSSSSSSSSPEVSPSQSGKPSHHTLHRSGSHFCIADHEPIVLTDTPNHCQHCQGTLQKLTEVSEINMTLAGCGFLCTYYLGVYEVLKNHGGAIFSKIRRWGGASAGSIAASLIVCHPENPWIGLTVAQRVIDDIRNKVFGVLSPSYSLMDAVKLQLEKHLPPNAHELATGNLYVSITKCTEFENEIVTEFHSREELIDAIICSCHIPIYSGFHPPEFKGSKYMDGFLTDNLPVYPYSGTTILVSPFSGCQHICPKDENWYDFFFEFSGHRFKVNPQNLKRCLHAFVKPSDETFMYYYELGSNDTTEFLKKSGCYESGEDESECDGYDTCLEDFESLDLEDFEEISLSEEDFEGRKSDQK